MNTSPTVLSLLETTFFSSKNGSDEVRAQAECDEIDYCLVDPCHGDISDCNVIL